MARDSVARTSLVAPLPTLVIRRHRSHGSVAARMVWLKAVEIARGS